MSVDEILDLNCLAGIEYVNNFVGSDQLRLRHFVCVSESSEICASVDTRENSSEGPVTGDEQRICLVHHDIHGVNIEYPK